MSTCDRCGLPIADDQDQWCDECIDDIAIVDDDLDDNLFYDPWEEDGEDPKANGWVDTKGRP